MDTKLKVQVVVESPTFVTDDNPTGVVTVWVDATHVAVSPVSSVGLPPFEFGLVEDTSQSEVGSPALVVTAGGTATSYPLTSGLSLWDVVQAKPVHDPV